MPMLHAHSRLLWRLLIGTLSAVSLFAIVLFVSNSNSSAKVSSSKPPSRYCLAAVSDEDERSKQKDGRFLSYTKLAVLSAGSETEPWRVRWEDEASSLYSFTGYKGRGMELSELVNFNGETLACDDRTGIIYSIKPNKAIRKWMLNDGDGNQEKGFKCEWMTVKDGYLYVGSIGKEWTFPKNDTIRNDHTLYVKKISKNGEISSIKFHDQYNALRKATGTTHPGYMIQEAVVWSKVYKRWFFLPRRVSQQAYNDDQDEKRGSNLVLVASEDFETIESRPIGPLVSTRGYSSAKILTHRHDVFAVLKSEEVKGVVKSYFSVFSIDGTVFIKDQFIGNYKFEGLEIVDDEWCLDYFNKKR
ncbi:hypothetical protein P9112_006819 [Eukaryota sp. TZLM1-RC]